MTITLANRNAIIRRLPAAETLGSTTNICPDKTGPLTRKEMTVQALWADGSDYPVSGIGYRGGRAGVPPDGRRGKGMATVSRWCTCGKDRTDCE